MTWWWMNHKRVWTLSHLVPVPIIDGKGDARRRVSVAEIVAQADLSVFDLQDETDGRMVRGWQKVHGVGIKCLCVELQRRNLDGDKVSVVDSRHVKNKSRLLRSSQLKLQDQPDTHTHALRFREARGGDLMLDAAKADLSLTLLSSKVKLMWLFLVSPNW